MKRMIDIPDEMFDVFKKHGIMTFDYLNEYDKDNLARIIANGIPYNPVGDLISRSALKAIIIEPLNVNDAGKNEWYDGYYTAKNEDVMTIDYAPPVSDRYDEGYARGYLDGSTGADWKGEEE